MLYFMFFTKSWIFVRKRILFGEVLNGLPCNPVQGYANISLWECDLLPGKEIVWLALGRSEPCIWIAGVFLCRHPPGTHLLHFSKVDTFSEHALDFKRKRSMKS